MSQISSTALALLCDISSKYEGRLIVDETGIEVYLHCKRPNMAVSKKINRQDMVFNRLRQDKIVELIIRQAAEELDDKIEQSFRRNT